MSDMFTNPNGPYFQGWVRRMLIACVLLAAGSINLIVGLLAFVYANSVPVSYERGLVPDFEALFTFALAGGLLLLIGWIYMGASARSLGAVGSGSRRRAVLWSFWASVVVFVVAYFLAVFVNPSPVAFLAALFPVYAPTVYGPLVAAQAILFLLASRSLSTKPAARMLAAAGLVLLTTALAALALAISTSPPGVLLLGSVLTSASLAGVIGGGYALAALALWLESRPRAGAPRPSPVSFP